MAKYPVGTDVRDVRGWDRGIKAIFECKDHPGIHYASKQPAISTWFPANQEAIDIQNGKPDPCPHNIKTGTWVLAREYEATDGDGL